MTRDCRCHRLFYPYFISSRSANSVNSLKTKTTISPVRKNCELFPRWKLPKSNSTINRLHSPSVSVRKRMFPHDSIDYELGEFDRVDAFFDEASRSIHLDTNSIIKRSPHKVNAMRPQHHYSYNMNRVPSELDSSRISSNSGTFPINQTSFETSKNFQGMRAHDSFQEKENYNDFSTRDFNAGSWKPTWIEKEDEHLSGLSPPTEEAQIVEDYEQLIFNMSPFTSSQPCSVFSTSDFSDRIPPDDFNNMEAEKDDPNEDDDDHDDDEDERSISITSVLPIDIPQPQKSI